MRDATGMHGYVSAVGDASQSIRGAGAFASTAGGQGTANSHATVGHLSLFGGLIRASSASVQASAGGGPPSLSGSVANLEIAGSPEGSLTSRRTYGVAGLGRVVVLGRDGDGIAAIRVKLTSDNSGVAAGTTVVVAFASAAASDAVGGASGPSSSSAPSGQPGHQPSGGGAGGVTGTGGGAGPANGAGSGGGGPALGGTAALPREVPPAVRLLDTNQGFMFPVYGPHDFTDTFGAFRADTGFHEGNDIFAAAGTPEVAVTGGTLFNVGTLPISGNRLWVRSDRGDCFFYAHMSAFATDARDGLHVKAGQVVGFVGSTGDAERTPPHLHFEVHPACGPAVDPYPFLKAWESRRDVPASAWLVQYARAAGVKPGALVEVKDYLAGG
ncbi:MAG: M23 family metallopeptidase [Actinobacteria bacterium]|nr:M23 family metallopeptidase [Actinomycetota bacterium]